MFRSIRTAKSYCQLNEMSLSFLNFTTVERKILLLFSCWLVRQHVYIFLVINWANLCIFRVQTVRSFSFWAIQPLGSRPSHNRPNSVRQPPLLWVKIFQIGNMLVCTNTQHLMSGLSCCMWLKSTEKEQHVKAYDIVSNSEAKYNIFSVFLTIGNTTEFVYLNATRFRDTKLSNI